MNILYVTTISNTINAFLVPHIKYLIEQGHKVDIACNVIREINPELIKLGCDIYNIEFQRSPLKKGNYNAYKKIKKLVVEKNYDLIHTHTPVASFITRLACRNIKGLKILYTAHGFHFFKGAPLINWMVYYPLELIAARWTDGLITINEADYMLARRLNLRKPKAVYKISGIGVDLSRFIPQMEKEKKQLRNKYNYNENEFILFYAAALNYNKHQDLLIDAVSLLKAKIPNIKLLLAGSGNYKTKYEKQVRKLGLEENVEFLGYRTDIPELLRLSDVAVTSSRREGLPVNVMEAMATGLPLVASDCRGNHDLVSNEENGYLINENDVKGFSSSIEYIFKSKEIGNRFREQSLFRVRRYSINNVLKEMENIFNLYLSAKDNEIREVNKYEPISID